MNWNNEKEEERWILYLLGFNDGQIGILSEPATSKSNVCSWRRRRELSPNNGLGDNKWYPPDNPMDKELRNSPGLPLSKGREELLLALYNEGFNDAEIAKKASRAKTTIRRWRLKKGLSANAQRGGQSVQKSGDKIKREPKKKIGRAPKISVRQMRKEIARKEEEEIVEGLPSKEEVHQKVRNSLDGQITTKQLIKERYGDVGSKRRDTIGKLRELVDEDGLLQLDTSGKEIVWIA